MKGVIDIAHFNDEAKIGKGQEMVDKLTKLIAIFQSPELDSSKNRAEGDDIIGDAYEYLMRNFATESGKSKGQFYTPAEASRILAQVIGIDKCKDRDATICDPACGSGSLLIRALTEAPFEIAGYGQEKESSTAGLAKMNAVLHNKPTIRIMSGSTFSDPQFLKAEDASELERFDYIVANPPFSLKNWSDGLKEYGRFTGFGDRPPEKNGDYAWLMHILKTLKSTGKAAVILPHGVLFRGNAEGTIRKTIVDKGWIKGIIGLPANLFYGTGIPACIMVIDKEGADNRAGIFMIDAGKGYVKDGNKNRLREQDSVRGYRNSHKSFKPGHPFERLDDSEYLRVIGAAGISKEDKRLHPTAAGMLMFGNEYDIVRYFPEYFLDYRENPDTVIRWTDRLQSSSGEWSGNLFDFYFRVYNKIIKDIKVPFKIEGGFRIDDTSVHRALREALANCIINTDFYGKFGVTIIKEDDKLTLENPGYIRLGKEQMRRGGKSDPRNKSLMKMFNLIDIGEHAGSGVPNIFNVWEDEGWEEPVIEESFDPDRTSLTLRFVKKQAIKTSDKKQAIKNKRIKLTKIWKKSDCICKNTKQQKQEILQNCLD